jgi:hypothetical protein
LDFFRHALSEAEPTDNCRFCNESLIVGKGIVHAACRREFNEVLREEIAEKDEHGGIGGMEMQSEITNLKLRIAKGFV